MNPSMSLHEACCEGDDDKVLHWIRGGASVNEAGDVNAASNIFEGDLDLFRTLQSPLGLAAWHGHLGTAQILVKYGATINNQDSPFVMAATKGHLSLVSFLLLMEHKSTQKMTTEGQPFRRHQEEAIMTWLSSYWKTMPMQT